jgi:hypothetical protein
MTWVMTLLTALIALMLPSLHGKAAFCCAMALNIFSEAHVWGTHAIWGAHAFWGKHAFRG